MDNSTRPESKYFAATRDPKKLGSNLVNKVKGFQQMSKQMGITNKLKNSWASYHGMFWNTFGGSHQVTFTGEQGELSQLPVNHLRNIVTHMKTMTLASRPALDARAANTDPKSLVQAQLATGLLDYYLREMRLEKHIAMAVETALVLGSGYIQVEWDTSKGQIVEQDEETGFPVREGDLAFCNLSPFEVIHDVNKSDDNHNWLITISYKNRYDLIAKFPEYEKEIESLPGKDKLEGSLVLNRDFASDEIPVFTFFHKPTDSLPNGRHVVFLSEDVILTDLDLPYKKIPIFRVSAADILGTCIGYANTYDLLPLQDAINTLYTSVFSNNVALGTQNLFVETGANLNVTSLSGGLNVIEGLKKPEPLNLVASSPETYQLINKMESLMETISGINSVVRGNPEANLKSGTSLAVVQSQAVQFINGLQQQYIQLLEDLGTCIIEILKDYATEPRVVSIVGNNNKAYLKQFKADDIQEVNRVVVDVGNPLSKTFAGRIQMAEQLMQMKADEFTIDQYIQVINTGKLDVMTNKNTRKLNQIELENERLMAGKETKVLILDDHAMHIQEHASLLDDPDIRDNDEIAEVILNHIQQHMDLASDPGTQALHQLMGHKPIPQQQSPSQQPNPENMNQPQGNIPANMGEVPPANQPPQQPNMPQSPTGQPTQPDQQMAMNTGG
jgi:hypothetical protein